MMPPMRPVAEEVLLESSRTLEGGQVVDRAGVEDVIALENRVRPVETAGSTDRSPWHRR